MTWADNTIKPSLLGRNDFRTLVFARDHGICVVSGCNRSAADAHHIIERRLWPDGGYYLANGASVCEDHHLAAERTNISPEQLRTWAGIDTLLLPPQLYRDETWDKWGNPVLADGRRAPGELYWDISVQKVLREGGVLDKFITHSKYPRTPHLPWSMGQGRDDMMWDNVNAFEGQQVVVTAKLDGENVSLYCDGLHARSLDSRPRSDQSWIRAYHASIAMNIPLGYRIAGEYLWAEHSIHYDELSSYFVGFSVWDGHSCLNWDETQEWLSLLDIVSVPVLYRGLYDETAIRGLWSERDQDRLEGYVVRVAGGFEYGDFGRCVAKFVRPGHIGAERHWRYTRTRRNQLAPM